MDLSHNEPTVKCLHCSVTSLSFFQKVLRILHCGKSKEGVKAFVSFTSTCLFLLELVCCFLYSEIQLQKTTKKYAFIIKRDLLLFSLLQCQFSMNPNVKCQATCAFLLSMYFVEWKCLLIFCRLKILANVGPDRVLRANNVNSVEKCWRYFYNTVSKSLHSTASLFLNACFTIHLLFELRQVTTFLSLLK